MSLPFLNSEVSDEPGYIVRLVAYQVQYSHIATLGLRSLLRGGHRDDSTLKARVRLEARAEVAPDEASPIEQEVELDVELLARSQIFDASWYLDVYRDIARSGMDPFEHYSGNGWKEGRNPNAYFNHSWYVEQPAYRSASGMPSIQHYLEHGERSGANPSQLFNSSWYRRRYEIEEGKSALADYLSKCKSGLVAPIPEFDIEFYAVKNPDIIAAGVDPFAHYLQTGHLEGRNPSPNFESKFYRERYLGEGSVENPLVHFLRNRESFPGLVTAREVELSWSTELKKASKPGSEFEEFRPASKIGRPRAKVLAFYLPQFYEFPENNTWWGEGFTEWTNTSRGAPRFEGHYQPRVPRDLGFYNTLSPGVIQRQIDLAIKAGLSGFIFYFYWFNRKRLMERPLDLFLADDTRDFPFALMWANENWTRRWDGLDDEVLIRQDYEERDDEALVATLSAYTADRRYIKIGGRPIIMIYRPGLIPDAKLKIRRWRDLFISATGVNPIFIMAQGFGDLDPGQFGLDGAIEFPPHKIINKISEKSPRPKLLDANFKGTIFDYGEAAEASLGEPAPDFPLIKTAFPSWDNDARRQGNGMAIHGSTPALYEKWLDGLINFSRQNPFFGEQIVAINAWNEWAEGAYLEPDIHFGSAYLNATSRAIAGLSIHQSKKICIVGHDAHPHGAQLLVRALAEIITRRFGMQVEILVLGGGKLIPEYKDIAGTSVEFEDAELRIYFEKLAKRGFKSVIVNSVASIRACEHAAAFGMEPILLVHELPSIMHEKALIPQIERAVESPELIIFPAEFVKAKFFEAFGSFSTRSVVAPQGSYKSVEFSEVDRLRIRASLGINQKEIVVLSVGFADLRKGFDLFLGAWRASERRGVRAHFIWLGGLEVQISTYLQVEIELATKSGRFHLVPFTREVAAYYSAADVFLLTSREDPFPTVVLEALESGIPAIAFDASGGIPEMLRHYGAGRVVPLGDCEAVVEAVSSLATSIDVSKRAAGNLFTKVCRENFQFPNYAFSLLSAGRKKHLKISVIVPNYNYARYLPSRLASIFNQDYPIFELIVLDDASTDDSTRVIEEIRSASKRDITVIVNEGNSGSVFRQWSKGIQAASGDFIWIAEADDDARPDFLARLAESIDDRADVVAAFADSRVVDENGDEISPDYKFYYEEGAPGMLLNDRIFSSDEFLSLVIGERNLMMNVSACIWRRDVMKAALRQVGEDLWSYKVAGDWLLYVNALNYSNGPISYVADPLNVHRRHRSSVTLDTNKLSHIREIGRVQQAVLSATRMNDQVQRRQSAYLKKVASEMGVSLNDL